MTQQQYLKNLTVPSGKIDVVLDTDTFNEIDDQFAIAYMLASTEKLNVKGICAAPFLNGKATSPQDGMEKSYNEILKLLNLMGLDDKKDIVHKGSPTYLSDENTPVESDASNFLANLANDYSPENPLYIVSIGAITNVASAILKNPKIIENAVIVWLGGHAHHISKGVHEFNMFQDVAAARIVFGCSVPLVQLPCVGVVTHLTTSRYELEHWLKGKNKVSDYLVENTVNEAETYGHGKPWTRTIWDISAVAWLLNDNDRFMSGTLVASPIPEHNLEYTFDINRHQIRYINAINRDAIFEDVFNKLANWR